MRAEVREFERAVATGTREAGRRLKTELRRQIARAGLGQRIANSWRDKLACEHRSGGRPGSCGDSGAQPIGPENGVTV
jgi:hypothetical protein